MVRPYQHTYDGIIVHYMVKECFRSAHDDAKRRWVPIGGKVPYVPLPQSFTTLYRVIKNSGYPTVSRTTVQRHLNKMVRERVLTRLPTKQRYNQTLYRLSTRKLIVYSRYLVDLVSKLVLRRMQKKVLH